MFILSDGVIFIIVLSIFFYFSRPFNGCWNFIWAINFRKVEKSPQNFKIQRNSCYVIILNLTPLSYCWERQNCKHFTNVFIFSLMMDNLISNHYSVTSFLLLYLLQTKLETLTHNYVSGGMVTPVWLDR